MSIRLRAAQKTIWRIGILCGIALAAAVACSKAGSKVGHTVEAVPSQIIRVIDGDTIEINGEKIRLYGIDAPERGQPCKKNEAFCDCGEFSKKHLEFLLAGAVVACAKRGKDRWGRWIGHCIVDGEDLSRMMVRHGWAVAYRRYSAAYVQDEEFARSNRLGMWSKEFLMPSEWRKAKKGDRP